MTDIKAFDARPAAVALGTFDGVHLGHQALLRAAVRLARENGWAARVYTFENHPRSVFAEAPEPLSTIAARKDALLKTGVDGVDMVPFTKETAVLSPREFVLRLKSLYDLRAVVVGSDYTFGCKGAGDVSKLRTLGAEFGFSVLEIPPVYLYGQKVSSTRIREALKRGDGALAREMLGRK